MRTVDAILAHLSVKPWSAYKESDYSIDQWHSACLIHQHQGPPTSKSQCKLPVKTPNGAVNKNGVHAAAAALAGARGGVIATDEEKASAKTALLRLYGQLNEDPPDSLKHSDDEELDEFLEHHGIKGMKWGVRRSVDSSTGLVKRTSSADQIHVDRIQKKLKSGGTGALSNKDLQDFSSRIQKEQEFNRARASLEAQKGDKFIRGFLKSQGKRQFHRVADKAIDIAVEKMLEEAGLKVGKKGGNPDVADTLVKVSKRLQPKKGK